ncbi:MAG TPA: hypothetical protein VL490_09850 [Mucilaginibacter sp.]|jgi:hypothetical protein|nr:hypothetical protein [Mucilaginibacter sp.]
MTTAAIREKLHEYINEADDKKVEAIYTLLEDQIAPAWEWSEDEEFLAELDERYKRWEDGTDKGRSIDEVKAVLQQLKKDRKGQL